MLARVLTSKGPHNAQLAQQFADRVAQLDGCEGCWIVANPASNETLSFTLYRDQEAAEAASAVLAGIREEATNAGYVLGSPKVFGRVVEGKK